MFRSIRFKIALSYTILVALTFLLIAGAIYLYISRTLEVSLDQAIIAEASWVSARTERSFQVAESLAVLSEEIREHTSYYPIKEYVEVWDTSGRIVYRTRNLATDTLKELAAADPTLVQSIETLTGFRNHELRLTALRSKHVTVFLAMPPENILEPLRQLAKIFLWLGPFVILCAIGVGIGLAKTSFTKINKVVETAQNITAERLQDRIPEHETQDEIGKIITTFNAMISRLDVSFNQVKQFSADASHELRTPLAVMRTQLERALASDATIVDLKKIAANCLDETLRMTSIAEDLLFLSRADAGQEIVVSERIRLDELIRGMYEESVIIASQRSISVVLNGVEEATILGEESRLRRMLLNLVDNAVKYNHDHGTIGIGLTKSNGTAKIVISDSGIGIPAEEVSRIFDRFYRVDRARSREMGGTGLGLSIVHLIVKAHGGSISVRSELQKGSEFCVVLPLAPA